MKTKSLALLAMSGLLAAMFTYSIPAFADDASMDDQTSQQSTSNGSDSSQDDGEVDAASGDDDY